LRQPLKYFYAWGMGILLGFWLAFGLTPVAGQISPLSVQGNQIVNSSGCTMHLYGVDEDGFEYCPVNIGWSGYSPVKLAQEAVTNWKVGIIRLPLNQDFWFGCPDYKSGGQGVTAANYQAAVSTMVSYCASQNVYVILDLHWSGASTLTGPTAPCTGAGWGQAMAQQPMADWNAVTFWSSVAEQYANNPAVLFDLYNEPYSSDGSDSNADWTQWRQGGTNIPDTWVSSGNVTVNGSFNSPGMQNLLNTVRSEGATNLCLVGGLQWSYNELGIINNQYALTDPANGIVVSAHVYDFKGSSSDWDANVTPASAKYPIFVGEYGPGGCNQDDTSFDSSYFPWLQGGNSNNYNFFGATAWSFNTGSCPNLLSSWTGVAAAWGQPVSNFLQTPAISGCPPTPTFTNTPCTDGMGHTCTPTVTATPTSTPTITLTPTPTNTFTITPTLGVVNVVWPNPWPDKNDPNPNQPLKFNFSNSQQESQVALKIYTVAFRKVFEDDTLPTVFGNSTYQVPLNNKNLSNGLYFFVIETKGGGSTNRQVMKVLILR
jgi:hypothetical protein